MVKRTERILGEINAKDILMMRGVDMKGKDISRGSYSLSTWAAIDCLLNHFKGYRLVN